MKISAIITVVVLALATGGYFYYQHAFPSYAVNYRITMNVETPDGIKSGSTVREYYYSRALMRGPHWGDAMRSRGEAVVVDLGDQRYLFGLVKWDSYMELKSVIPDVKNAPIGMKAELTNKRYWPKMVTFEDLNDPKTIKVVEKDHLDEIFGEGFKVASVEIEVTNHEIAWDINRTLPWLLEYYNKRFDGNRYQTIEAENKTANMYSSGSFSTKGIK